MSPHPFDPSYAQAESGARCVCGQPRTHFDHEANHRGPGLQVMRDVRERRIPLSRALYDMRSNDLTALELLAAAPAWSRACAKDVLDRMRISELRRCRSLTPRQRQVLAAIATRRDRSAA